MKSSQRERERESHSLNPLRESRLLNPPQVERERGDARPRLGQLRAEPRRVGRSQDPGGEQGRGAAAVPRRGGRGDLFKSLRGRRPDSSDVRALVLDGDRGLVSGL